MDDIRLPHNLNEFYVKGISALEKNNYEYAIELLLQVVNEEPAHALSRKALHQAERLQYESAKPSAVTALLIRLQCLIPLVIGLIYEMSRNDRKALAFYEEALRHFPYDTSLLGRITQIAHKNAWHEVAIVGYEDLLEAQPKNADYMKQLGYLHKKAGNIEQARQYFTRTIETKPDEQEIKKELKDIDALTSIRTGNWDDNQSYRTKISQSSLANERANIAHSKPATGAAGEIEQLQAQLAVNPADEKAMFALAQAYKKNNRLTDARALLEKLVARAPQTSRYTETLGETNELLFMALINDLDAKLEHDPSNAALRQQRDDVLKQRTRAALEGLRQKVEIYPNDLNIRFDLGSALFDLGEFTEAISQFQLAVKEPSKQTVALNKLGLCFSAKGMFDLAASQFQKALEREHGLGEAARDIMYNLAATFERMGKSAEAIELFKKIYEVDISYRDVAARIDAYYKKQ